KKNKICLRNPLFASECHLNLSFPYLFESTRTKDYLPGGTKTWARLKIKIPCPSFDLNYISPLNYSIFSPSGSNSGTKRLFRHTFLSLLTGKKNAPIAH
ncbi:MAG: hypothetical protein IJ582_00410, partial [Prevotella sp.]|nr:hypothetical protein [Prevotella sp.]